MIPHPLRKNCLFLILIVLSIIVIFSPTFSFADAEKIFKENRGSVVVVVAFDEKSNPISQGSGFVVSQDGAIVTNYHVISNAKDIAVKVGKRILKVEGLLYLDKENDIAILKAKGEKLQKVRIGDIGKVSVGEKVYVISSPQGLENTISDGVLSGVREIAHKRKILQITAPISKGSSGGPVFNKDGEVIGVATFIIEQTQNLNFAIPINIIRDKITGKKVTVLKDVQIEDYKKTAEYWFYLGVYYAEAGLYKEAIGAFKESIRSKPDYVETHYNLSVSYANLGMYKETIEACKQAIRIEPDYAEAHNNLGFAYDGLGMYKEAIEAFKQAIRIKPDYAEAHNNLGFAYDGLGMYKEAIEAFKQALRIKPGYAEAHYNLGGAYLILNDKGSALDEYKILKELDPQLANKLFNLIYK